MKHHKGALRHAIRKLILHSWTSKKAEVQKELQPYWSFRDDILVIDRTAMNDRRMIVSTAQQDKNKELHLNNMGIEKT